MRIICLEAENFKRLTAVSIKPDGNLVEITGRNGAGKSSVLDAIWGALAGKAAIQSQPIRKGTDSAEIRLDLGKWKVRRTFKRKDGGYTTAIFVEGADGARFPTPQALLDGLMGELSFDPLAFTRMKPAEQFDALKKFVPGVDFDKIDGLNKADYDKRTDVNRTAKELRARAAGIPVLDGGACERVDEAALVEELQRAGEHNAGIERDRRERQERASTADRASELAGTLRQQALQLREEAAELLRRAEAAEKQAGQAATDADKIVEELKALTAPADPIDPTAIRERITEARRINAAVDNEERRQDLIADAEIAEAEAADLTNAIAVRTRLKETAVAEAKMPIGGLSFGDGEVMLGGVPFEQASSAEQLRASMAIGMEMNPSLHVLLVRDGSLLDEDSMKLIAEMANGRDFQCWIERVGNDGKVGFVLEDGHIKGAAAQEAAE